MTNENIKKNDEHVWASIFVNYLNKTRQADYKIVPELAENSPIDMHAVSSSGKNPHLDLQLTHAIEVPFIALKEHMDVDFSSHPTIMAIERKFNRLSEQGVDLSRIVLVIQGFMSHKQAEKVFTHQAFDKYKTYPFAGIYYVSPPMISGETQESLQDGFVIPIKDFFENK